MRATKRLSEGAERANDALPLRSGVVGEMRPGARRTLLWAAPLAVLVAAVAVRLAMPDAVRAVQQPVFDYLATLTAQPLKRPAIADQIEEMFLILAGAVIVGLFARMRTAWAAAVLAVTAGAIGFLMYKAATDKGILFDGAYPSAALAATFLIGSLVPLVAGRDEQAQLKRSLGAHVAPRVMANLSRAPEGVRLGGEARTMTYLVCGIRRYPQLADAFADEPELLRRLTQRVLTALSGAVLKYHGTIDRIAPGGLTAFFNAPIEDPQHAIHACECALGMTRALETVNQQIEQERRGDGSPYPPIEIGIGIHTGAGVVGDFGAEGRPAYAAAGTGMPLAGEIETAGAKYGPAIIVSEATRQLAERNFALLEVDTINAANSPQPVKVFALLGNPLLRASPKFRALETFHEHIFQSYREGQWGKARALIEQCRTLSGASQQLYDLYLNRIAYFEAHPPGENWNGAVRAPIS